MDRSLNILGAKPKELFNVFLYDYGKIHDIDKNLATQMLKDKSLFKALTAEWYHCLKQYDMKTAYAVYNDDYYFVDLFDCFQTYSRKYLKSLVTPSLSDGMTIQEALREISSFVDLGCGLGYTTAALCDMFPNATGYATNLKKTKQWKFCQEMAEVFDFHLVEDVKEIGYHVDMVFASEYFEHIYRPLEHLEHILKTTTPYWVIVANSFNTESIGHFPRYKHKSLTIPQSKVSKLFNAVMRMSGYSKVKTNIWNNKPTIWVKNNN